MSALVCDSEQFLSERLPRYATWRRELHRHPELGFHEHQTSAFIANALRDMGLSPVVGLAGTGVVATIGGDRPGPRIGLRADMDALPLQERSDCDHASQRAGVAHACGHDGHVAMLLAAAEYLCHHRTFAGTVQLIFQPAEEALGGAREMIKQGLFQQFPVDYVFALHNWPGLPAGQIAARPGPVMASLDLFTIDIHAQGAHAALPHQGTDAIVTAGALINAIQSICSRSIDAQDPLVISLTQVHGGESLNALPDHLYLKGTIRALDAQALLLARQRLRAVVEGVCATHGVTGSIDIEARYPVTRNDEVAATYCIDTACALFGAARVTTNYRPSMASEDFAYMLDVVPGCYAWVGTGRDVPLHHPSYDFNDAIIPAGACYLVGLVTGAEALPSRPAE
jgi:amidohydrolase